MANYTVKQIAQMMNVDSETVRRWVRSGELKGELTKGRKGGFEIKQSDLIAFVDRYPKYQRGALVMSDSDSFNLACLDRHIYDLEETIAKLTLSLEELKKVRRMFTIRD